MAALFKLGERDVELRVVTFGDIMAANELRETRGNTASVWHVLSCSAHYTDDGSKVFQDMDAIMARPATDAGVIMRMSSAVAALNMPNVAEGKEGEDHPT